jgi:cation:H+ antiporter
MEIFLESWSLVVILLSAFVIGWAAETAQTFMSRALAFSILAWLQTLPEFAVEANIAWRQERSLMIANLTGSLRLITGLGLPMIFFVHFFFQGVKTKKFIRSIKLDDQDFLSILCVFISILYFVFIWAKGSLTVWDSIVLFVIYGSYLWLLKSFPAHESEEEEDLPWIGKQLVKMEPVPKVVGTVLLFIVGGAALYFSVHPFIDTLQKWSLSLGISTFIFIQWVAPFLSEFPEKVSAFNWARQKNKAPMAVMNMIGSNINQWTMLAGMIPVVFNLSLGHLEPVTFDASHKAELLLTIVQSLLVGVLLLDLEFSIGDAALIFILWFIQFVFSSTREAITWAYLVWAVWELGKCLVKFISHRQLPRTIEVAKRTYTRRSH